MRRRLDLAASLIVSPEVLFLDEPTAGLDPRSRNEVRDAVRGFVDVGTTVLLTTQYLDEADALARRIAVIDAGRVVAEGTADELKARLGATVSRSSSVTPTIRPKRLTSSGASATRASTPMRSCVV